MSIEMDSGEPAGRIAQAVRRSTSPPRQSHRTQSMAWLLTVLSFSAAVACYLSYRDDGQLLRRKAEAAVVGTAVDSDRVLALSEYVHNLRGTRANKNFFILPRFRATAAQVLDGGGDCADRSMLLVGLLREVDIPATRALCFDKKTGMPAHTIVEAKVGAGTYMAVDPTYGLYFPKPDGTGYYDLMDLRRDPDIVDRRVDEIAAGRGVVREADRYYLRASVSYGTASTMNWQRNALTQLVHAWLLPRYGHAVYRLPRPLFVEEPKLFAVFLFVSVGCASLLLPGIIACLGRFRLPHAKTMAANKMPVPEIPAPSMVPSGVPT